MRFFHIFRRSDGKTREVVKKCLVAMNTKRAEDRLSRAALTCITTDEKCTMKMGRRFGPE
jgi:hypothetical protein